MNTDGIMLALVGLAEMVAILVVLTTLGLLVAGVVLLVIYLQRKQLGSPAPMAGPAGGIPGRKTRDGATSGAAGGSCARCGGPRVSAAAEGLCPRCLLEVGLGTQSGDAGAESKAAVPEPEILAREFPALEVGELLGRGGMGMVFRARQKTLDRVVALKLLPRVEAQDPAFAERFHREARTLARLSHPSIVAVHEFGETPGFFFLILEYVEGTDLRQALRERRLAPVEALRIVPVLCEALQYAHAQGVVHRDIKPANILIDREGRVKITDFGIAKLMGQETGGVTLTQTRQTVGTPHYMAPEQVEAPQSVDHRADIYSLGVVFYEMLTGELPLGHFALPSSKVQVDVRLDEVVLRALAKEPERRYQAASQVKSEVERIAAAAPRESGPDEKRKAPGGDEAPRVAGVSPTGVAQKDTRLVWARVWTLLHLVTWAVMVFCTARRGQLEHVTPAGSVLILLALVGAWAPLGVTALRGWALRDALGRGSTGEEIRRAGRRALFFPMLAVVGAGIVFWTLLLRMTVMRGGPVAATAWMAGGVTGGVLAWWSAKRVLAWLQDPVGRRGWLLATSGVMLVLGVLASVIMTLMLTEAIEQSRRAVRFLPMPASNFVVPGDATGPALKTGPYNEGHGWRLTPDGPEFSAEAANTFLVTKGPDALAQADACLKRVYARYVEEVRRSAMVSTNESGWTVVEVPEMPAVLGALENEFWSCIDPLLGDEGRGWLRLGLKMRGRAETSRDPDGISVGMEYRNSDALLPIGDSPFTLKMRRLGAWVEYEARWRSGTGVIASNAEQAEWLRQLKATDWLAP